MNSDDEFDDALLEHVKILLDSGYDVVDLGDLKKRFPNANCEKVLRSAGYLVEEDMVFLRNA